MQWQVQKLRQLVCEDVCHAHLSHKDGRIKSLWSQNLPCTGSYVQLSLLYSFKCLPLILAVALIHILLLFFFLSFFRPSPCAPAEQHLRMRQALGRGEVGDTTDWADRICTVGTIGLIYICDKKSDGSGHISPRMGWEGFKDKHWGILRVWDPLFVTGLYLEWPWTVFWDILGMLSVTKDIRAMEKNG